jgi:small subunit ribosomal protein S16
MLTIRLSRVGKKKQAEYRLIINEKTKDPWGDALEYLGHYNPHAKSEGVRFNVERIKYWLEHGAQVSNTVRNIFIAQGIITGSKSLPDGIKKDKAAKEQAKVDKEARLKAAEEAAKAVTAEAAVTPEPEKKDEVPVEASVEEAKSE